MKTLILVGSLGQSRKSLLNVLMTALAGQSFQSGNEKVPMCPMVPIPKEVEEMSSVVGRGRIMVIGVLSTSTESIDPSFLESFVKKVSINNYDLPFVRVEKKHFMKLDKGTFPKTRTHTGSRRGHHGFW